MLDVGLGDELDALLTTLHTSGMRMGPRERVAAASLVLELSGQASFRESKADASPSLRRFRTQLSVLLAKSAHERDLFFRIFDNLTPEPPGPPLPDEKRKPVQPGPYRRPNRLAILTGAVLLLGVALLIWLSLRPPASHPAVAVAAVGGAPVTAQSVATGSAASPGQPGLARLDEAAANFEGAPTLDELAEQLARTSRDRVSRATYLTRLEDLTDLPSERPLPIGWPPPGPNAPAAARVSLTFAALIGEQPLLDAMLAQSIERIENPTREEKLADLLEDARAATRKPGPAIALAQQLATFRSPPGARSLGPGPPPDALLLQRAEAVVWDAPAGAGPWAPAPIALPWTPAAAAWSLGCGLALLGLFSFARSLEHRRAYLRRRPPAQSPLRTQLVAEALKRASPEALLSRQALRSLQQRSTQESGQLDIEATIRATMAGGGLMIQPRFARIRSSPDYLVFIERHAPGDQQAQRLLRLVDALRTLLHVEVFFYQSDTAYLERERGGPAAPIEQLMATHPRHRLIVLGSGLAFLDPVGYQPRDAAEKLRQWRQRALLTPLPAMEWAQEETALARTLAMPVGRATPAGLSMLGDLLRLDSGSADEGLLFAGDDLEPPLPRRLRVRPMRFLQTSPPHGESVPELLADLRRYLGEVGFVWLCALAVYPEIQFDLTLYLGLGLAEVAGGDGGTPRAYAESRLAALTQLPWLQAGRMPVWLRRALIAALPKARAKEIRKVLGQLIREAREVPEAPAGVVLQIGVEPASRRRLDAAFRDEVLLDFLARGDAEDFRLPEQNALNRIIPRRFLPLVDWTQAVGLAVAAAFLAAGILLTPRPGLSIGGADAWLPLACLIVCALPAAFLASPRQATRLARSVAVRFAPAALTLALFGFAVLAYNRIDALDRSWLPVLLLPTLALPLLTRWMFGVVGGPIARKRGGWPGLAGLLGEMLATWILAGAAAVAADLLGPATLLSLVVAGATWFGLGWLAARTDTPTRLTEPPAPSASWMALRLAGALALIVPAFALEGWMVAQTMVLHAPGGAALTAASTGAELLAIVGPDGQARVYDLASSAPASPMTPRTRIGGIALAVGRADRRTLVATAATDGSVRYLDVGSNHTVDLPGIGSGAMPAKLAISPSGALMEAIETPQGATLLRSWIPRGVGAPVWTHSEDATRALEGVAVTALGAVGPDAFAIGLDDGRVALVSVDANGSIVVAFSTDRYRLSGTIRLIKPLDLREGVSTFWAIGDDGSRLIGTVRGARLSLAHAPPIDALDLQIPRPPPLRARPGPGAAGPNAPSSAAPPNQRAR